MAKRQLRTIVAQKVASMAPLAEAIQLTAMTARPASTNTPSIRKKLFAGKKSYDAGDMKRTAAHLSDLNDALERLEKRTLQRK